MVMPVAQNDVCAVREGAKTTLVVVLQDDLLSDLTTRVVAPLIGEGAPASPSTVSVAVVIDGRPYLCMLQMAATVRARDLGVPVASLAPESRRISRGLDLLFFGV
jgi:toxin CcdB